MPGTRTSLSLVVSGGGSAATGLGIQAEEPRRPRERHPTQELTAG